MKQTFAVTLTIETDDGDPQITEGQLQREIDAIFKMAEPAMTHEGYVTLNVRSARATEVKG